MTLTTDMPRVLTANFRNPRAWVAMLFGVVGLGAGLGLMLTGGFGVAPLDVLFSGVSVASGWSVGTIVFLSYALMVAISWPFGIRPGIGTLLCVLGVGPAVDITMTLVSGIPTEWGLAGQVACWVIGMLLFALGVVSLFAADLGVSPYDQVTRAASLVLRRSLGVGRLAVDVTCFAIGFILGGSWGLGTLILLGVLPAALTWILPRIRNLVAAGA